MYSLTDYVREGQYIFNGMKCILGIAAKKPDFDYDAFFRAYADLWFAKMEPAGARYYVEEDDKMYLAPEDRIVI